MAAEIGDYDVAQVTKVFVHSVFITLLWPTCNHGVLRNFGDLGSGDKTWIKRRAFPGLRFASSIPGAPLCV